MSRVEIHFHLLPGIDDGPPGVPESLELAAAAVADRTGTVIATPHVHPDFIADPLEVRGRTEELVARLRERRIPLRVVPGGELADTIAGRLSQAQLEAIAHGPTGRRWLLLEAPFRGLDSAYRAAADDLRARGFAIVVAHPERAMHTPGARAVLEHELTAGSVLQINAWSLTGEYGPPIEARAAELLRSAPRAVIASDAHGGERQPWLSRVLARLPPGSERFASGEPRALLEHGLSVPPAALVA